MTRRARGSLLLLVVGVVIMAFSLTAPAAEEGGDDVAGSTTTSVDSGLSPAVSVVPEQPPTAEPDWTYRYLIPTGLVLAGIIVVVTSVKYFTDVVRKRYRIVE